MGEPMIRAEMVREYKRLGHEEKVLLSKNGKKKPSIVRKKLEDKIPDKLEGTLNAAFAKAFELVFNYGTVAISKTVSEDKGKYADTTETAATFMEGTVLGIMGVGVPDIPVYTAVVLRSIYQIAEDCGFDYENKAEKAYILMLIECSLSKGEYALKVNEELDRLASEIDDHDKPYYGLLTEYMNRAAKALSDDMLYMKFIQSVPVVGAAGGVSNAVTLKKIRRFAEVKYKRRQFGNMLKQHP